ncbi:MAG: UDP-N-acetylmuramoyl-L-alanyl-D-glutamate--2,6-diaminopimelate ligase [Oscillospiraceae bacterium]|jgi:UDP-N-acetylmuramoyl-L-alanyl-D-glutamate--2,6-diaminopimelate ligase
MMKAAELLKGIAYAGTPPDAEVSFVTADSRHAGPGAVFVAIKGKKFDGHDAAEQAIESGAAMVVTERHLGLPGEITVANTRRAYTEICENFFGNPQKELRIIAVTGTNGKTTTANIMEQVLKRLGEKAALIGTIGTDINGLAIPAKFTTPEPWELFSMMRRAVDDGCTWLVMEASSQALDQNRLDGIDFSCSIFTNLTEDHLDYHVTMENYYQAKKKLFLSSRMSLINIDDPYGVRLAGELSEAGIPYSTYSAVKSADYSGSDFRFRPSGIAFKAVHGDEEAEIEFHVPGKFSIYNALSAAAALDLMGIPLRDSAQVISGITGISGRCEVLHSGDATVICDYAHTADALEQILSSLKPFTENRLIALFGCAGERDPAKRRPMAEAVRKYADYVFVTSDNPRHDNPAGIMNDYIDMFADWDKPYTIAVDRYFAVAQALSMLEKGDMLVLCAKGHEDYQALDGYTVYQSEHDIVRRFYDGTGGEPWSL